jgi:hypothetical protein
MVQLARAADNYYYVPGTPGVHYMVVTSDGGIIRLQPTADSDLVTTLPRGTRVVVVGPYSNSGWAHVQANGYDGYMDFVQLTEAAAPYGTVTYQTYPTPTYQTYTYQSTPIYTYTAPNYTYQSTPTYTYPSYTYQTTPTYTYQSAPTYTYPTTTYSYSTTPTYTYPTTPTYTYQSTPTYTYQTTPSYSNYPATPSYTYSSTEYKTTPTWPYDSTSSYTYQGTPSYPYSTTATWPYESTPSYNYQSTPTYQTYQSSQTYASTTARFVGSGGGTVRQAPNSQSPVIATLSPGIQVSVVGTPNGYWSHIIGGGLDGYILDSQLQ